MGHCSSMLQTGFCGRIVLSCCKHCLADLVRVQWWCIADDSQRITLGFPATLFGSQTTATAAISQVVLTDNQPSADQTHTCDCAQGCCDEVATLPSCRIGRRGLEKILTRAYSPRAHLCEVQVHHNTAALCGRDVSNPYLRLRAVVLGCV